METYYSHLESFVLFPDGILGLDSESVTCLWYPSPCPGSGSGNLTPQRSFSSFSSFIQGRARPREGKELIQGHTANQGKVGTSSFKDTKKRVNDNSPLLEARRRLGFSPTLATTPVSNILQTAISLDTSPVPLPT